MSLEFSDCEGYSCLIGFPSPLIIGMVGDYVMKIELDRRSCNCWEPACEAHFGWHFLREDVTPVDCTVEMIDDGQSEITFFIKDRDGVDKMLVVDETNRDVAYDSWFQAYEDQQATASKDNP